MFWADLRRRKVVRVAVAYAIVAWLLVQIVVSVETPLSLPPWTDTLVIVLLAIGFPVALIVSWIFDLTPEGLRRTPKLASGTATERASAGRRYEYAMFGLVVVAVGWLLYRTELTREESAPPANPSGTEADIAPVLRDKWLAVLPIESFSPSAEDGYFASGLHEEIIGQLAKIEALRVISRTSVMRYGGTSLTVPQIAAELGVGAVVESSVRYADGRIRVTAQLIDAATDEHLWAETYERPFEDIFAIQTDIATKIAAALEAELSSDELRRIERSPTDSSEAYKSYLRGRAAFAGTQATMVLAQSYFDQAIALDPDFALPHAWKALFYLLPVGAAVGAVPEDPAARARLVDLGRQSAQRALALDPNLGIAHTALGWVHQYDWSWPAMSAAFARAVELAPNEPSAAAANGFVALYTADREQALAILRRAAELDPNRAVFHVTLGVALRELGDERAAIAAFEQALILDPAFVEANEGLALAYGKLGDVAASRRAARLLEGLWRSDPRPALAPMLIRAFRAAQLPEDAQRIHNELESLALREPVSAMTWFLAYHALSDVSRALDWLETAVRTHDTYGRYVFAMRARNELTESLWDDARFQAARRVLGFAD